MSRERLTICKVRITVYSKNNLVIIKIDWHALFLPEVNSLNILLPKDVVLACQSLLLPSLLYINTDWHFLWEF